MKRYGISFALAALMAVALVSSAFAGVQYGGPPMNGDPTAKAAAMQIAAGSVKVESAKLTYVSGADTFNFDLLELTVSNPKGGPVSQLLIFGSHPDFPILSHMAKGDWAKFQFATDPDGGAVNWAMWNLPAGYLRLAKGPSRLDLIARAQTEADKIAEVGTWRIRPLVQCPTDTNNRTRLVVLFQNGTGGNAQFVVNPSNRQWLLYRNLDPNVWTTVGTRRSQRSLGLPGSTDTLDWVSVEGPGKD